VSSAKRKPEDSVVGCRAFAASDLERAAATLNEHIRSTFERSAEAWAARAKLLERLEAAFNARLAAQGERSGSALPDGSAA